MCNNFSKAAKLLLKKKALIINQIIKKNNIIKIFFESKVFILYFFKKNIGIPAKIKGIQLPIGAKTLTGKIIINKNINEN